MLVEDINKLKSKLEDQILKKDSYDNIYETSVEIDKLLIDYYRQHNPTKRGLNC